jgi:UDP-hydrolysing UDP-N-acetyl-D-glucosamine 2-epimerase
VRKICVVTSSRADFGIYLPVLRQIQGTPSLALQLLVTGSHLSPEFGMTVKEIDDHGFDTSLRVEMLLSSDTSEGIAKSMGLALLGFAQTYANLKPDLLLVLGDRFEMHSAVAAALPFRLPVAHIAGGEITEGALDDLIRHSISKMSHLHFVSTEQYAKRLSQMGEEPWRIHVTGTPALDNLKSISLISRSELENHLGLKLEPPGLIITLHPETQAEFATQIDVLLEGLNSLQLPMVFTSPNSDSGGRSILERIREWVSLHDNARLVANLGTEKYYSLMAESAAMVGNSSSGIVEAASFELPVVNIGARQNGRPQPANVLNCGFNAEEISRALQLALAPRFRHSLKGLVNPFGDGSAAARIGRVLTEIDIDQRLLIKRFYDQGTAANTENSGLVHAR